ncbi:MAG: 5'-3' exonuclease H3TH domain-containing protein [Alphaproteobacteria bacterium]
MKHVVIIDGLSFFFRAFHAVRGNLSRTSDGLPTNALYGFTQMLFKVITDLKPDMCCVALDSVGKTFRDAIYLEYKANRAEMDEAMKAQLPYFEPLIHAFDVPALRVEGVEADDIIATLSTRYAATHKVTIVSSDKDLMQLIGGNVTMLDTMKDKTFGVAEVFEKFGVSPDKVTEVQALIGDSSDNVPGVKGIGPKTAAELIGEFGTLEGIYADLSKVKRDKVRENLTQFKKEAFLSRELVTLKRDVSVEVTEEKLHWTPDYSHAKAFLVGLDFHSLAARLDKLSKGKNNGFSPVYYSGSESAQENKPLNHNENSADKIGFAPLDEQGEAAMVTEAIVGGELRVDDAFVYANYTCVTTPDQWRNWMDWCKAEKRFAVDTETTGLDPMQADVVGVSLAVRVEGRLHACYVPVGHVGQGEGLLAEEIPQLPKAQILADVRALLQDASLTKVGHNLKYDWLVLAEALRWPAHRPLTELIVNFEDTMLLSAAVEAGNTSHGLDALAQRHLNHTMIKFTDVAGVGQKQVTFDRVELPAATRYAAEDAEATLRLFEVLKPKLAGDLAA